MWTADGGQRVQPSLHSSDTQRNPIYLRQRRFTQSRMGVLEYIKITDRVHYTQTKKGANTPTRQRTDRHSPSCEYVSMHRPRLHIPRPIHTPQSPRDAYHQSLAIRHMELGSLGRSIMLCHVPAAAPEGDAIPYT